MRHILTIVIGLLCGAIAAFAVYAAENSQIRNLSIAAEPGAWSHKATTSNGQSEQYEDYPTFLISGFQPFWLLDFADTDYSRYSNHISYFGLQIDTDGSIIRTQNAGETEPGYANLRSERGRQLIAQLREDGIPVSIAVQMVDEDMIVELMKDPETHATTLVEETIPIIEEYGFTELNLDIESFVYAPPERQQAFTTFVSTVRNRISEESPETVISIDVAPISLFTERLLDMEQLSPLVDYIVIMTYDFHTAASPSTGPVAPVYGGGEVRDFDIMMSVEALLDYAEPKQVLLGIPTYGYQWRTLSDTYQAPAIIGSGLIRSQNRIEEELQTCTRCRVLRNELSLQPYAIFEEENGYRLAYYEDSESLEYKIKLAQRLGLGGIALWALGYENDSMREVLADTMSQNL